MTALSEPQQMVSPQVSPERWALLLPHQERLRRLARSRLHSAQDAEDCAQEALLRAALFPHLDERRVGAFLTSTVLRLCVDVHRGANRQHRLRQRIGDAERPPGPEETVVEAAVGDWMMVQAQQLRGRERQVILARADGMSTVDAARHLQISVKAVESALGRARARLRVVHDRTMRPDGPPRQPSTGRRPSARTHPRGLTSCPGTERR